MSEAELLRRQPARLIGSRLERIRSEYFQNRTAAALTLLFGGLAAVLALKAFDWAFLSARWGDGDPEVCETVAGACWAFVWEKWSVILLGAFPREEMWRPFVGVGLVLCVLVTLGALRWPPRRSVLLLLAAFIALFSLLDGRPLGLEQVDMVRWHGIAVVTFLGVFSIFAGFPIGILLALARFNGPPLLSWLAAGYIEVIRAVPLVTVLFFGVFVLPLLLPPSMKYEPLAVTLLALTLFHAAYFAEDVRSGLQSIPRGQWEAGEALGLGYTVRIRCIILPQALSVSIPSLTNTVIGGFKDTSLVAIVGIFDLLATTRMAYSDPAWQPYALEGLLVVGILYLIACSAISRHSQTMEQHVAGWMALRK
ncbi:amino acid ABC transporter permease [Algihabitans albus]|uniref:amino acid ABC transporter permease n=1 Tax=Algihabitans albus TaxID=2164067 RepID=UPI0035D07659